MRLPQLAGLLCQPLLLSREFWLQRIAGATVNGGNGNGNGNGKGSSKLPATIVMQLKMEEIYGWSGT